MEAYYVAVSKTDENRTESMSAGSNGTERCDGYNYSTTTRSKEERIPKGNVEQEKHWIVPDDGRLKLDGGALLDCNTVPIGGQKKMSLVRLEIQAEGLGDPLILNNPDDLVAHFTTNPKQPKLETYSRRRSGNCERKETLDVERKKEAGTTESNTTRRGDPYHKHVEISRRQMTER